MEKTDIDDILLKLKYLNETKKHIKAAIKEKGQSVSENDTFRNFANKIRDIDTAFNLDIDYEKMGYSSKPTGLLDTVEDELTRINNFLDESSQYINFSYDDFANLSVTYDKIVCIPDYMSGFSGESQAKRLYWKTNIQNNSYNYIAPKVIGKQDYSNFTSANLPGLPQAIFSGNQDLRHIYGPINLTSVTGELSYLFKGCNNIKEIPEIIVGNNITNLNKMFSDCYKLRRVPTITFGSTQQNMDTRYMFGSCWSLLLNKGTSSSTLEVKDDEINYDGAESVLDFLIDISQIATVTYKKLSYLFYNNDEASDDPDKAKFLCRNIFSKEKFTEKMNILTANGWSIE